MPPYEWLNAVIERGHTARFQVCGNDYRIVNNGTDLELQVHAGNDIWDVSDHGSLGYLWIVLHRNLLGGC